jgi:two-component system, LytTR family, sensor histidine kinase LytS
MQKIHYVKVKNRIIYCLLFLFLGFFLFIFIKNQNLLQGDAKAGYLGLAQEMTQEDVITLDGEWEFYPMQLRTQDFTNPYYIQVPGGWNQSLNTKNVINRYGYGTYRLIVRLKEHTNYCIKTRFLSSAYRIYINGKYVEANGCLSTSKEGEVASWEPKIIQFQTEQADTEIIIQVSNYTCYEGGIITSIVLGSPTAIYKYGFLNVLRNATFMGIIIGIGFFLIIFNVAVRKNRLSGWLGLFCIASFLLELIFDGEILFSLFPNAPVALSTKIEYLAFIGQVFSMIYFVRTMYPEYTNKKVFYIIRSIDGVYFVAALIASTLSFVYTDFILVTVLLLNCFYCVYVTILSRKSYKKSSYILQIGIGLLLLGGILQLLDMRWLLHRNLSISEDFYILGVLLFILCQSYIIFFEIEENFRRASLAKKMEIAFLQAQIAPHFFFNVINNIYYLMDEDVSLAKRLLLCFSDFLRVKHKFDYRSNVFYTLKEELDLVNSFVEIENIRLDNNIILTIEVDETILQTKILPLLLQPLVENSIKHGFRGEPLSIWITISQENEGIRYCIKDNGKGISKNQLMAIMQNEIESKGVGINNINYRLHDCYGTMLHIDSMLGEGTTITFFIQANENYRRERTLEDESCNN